MLTAAFAHLRTEVGHVVLRRSGVRLVAGVRSRLDVALDCSSICRTNKTSSAQERVASFSSDMTVLKALDIKYKSSNCSVYLQHF